MKPSKELFEIYNNGQKELTVVSNHQFAWVPANSGYDHVSIPDTIVLLMIWSTMRNIPSNTAVVFSQLINFEYNSADKFVCSHGKITLFFDSKENKEDFGSWVTKHKVCLFTPLPQNTSETFTIVRMENCATPEVSLRQVEICAWLEKNCKSNVYYHGDYFFFTQSSEATMFKLAWGGK